MWIAASSQVHKELQNPASNWLIHAVMSKTLVKWFTFIWFRVFYVCICIISFRLDWFCLNLRMLKKPSTWSTESFLHCIIYKTKIANKKTVSLAKPCLLRLLQTFTLLHWSIFFYFSRKLKYHVPKNVSKILKTKQVIEKKILVNKCQSPHKLLTQPSTFRRKQTHLEDFISIW